MEQKTSAYYQRLYRQRLREQGLIKKELWILPEYSAQLAELEQQMRLPGQDHPTPRLMEDSMTRTTTWTTETLLEALNGTSLARDGRATLELIEGTVPSLLIRMHDYGELPLFLAVAGGQIIVEAYLWPVSMVQDPVQFNEQILRMQKLFPLSSVGIETTADQQDAYIMFGALSAGSILDSVLYEIDTLADNVVRITEAFESSLNQPTP